MTLGLFGSPPLFLEVRQVSHYPDGTRLGTTGLQGDWLVVGQDEVPGSFRPFHPPYKAFLMVKFQWKPHSSSRRGSQPHLGPNPALGLPLPFLLLQSLVEKGRAGWTVLVCPVLWWRGHEQDVAVSTISSRKRHSRTTSMT